jgi:hypothetical protein
MPPKAKRKPRVKSKSQGNCLLEEHEKLDNAFSDASCHVAKIMTHTRNKRPCVGPHLGHERVMKDQLCNEHEKTHHD